uniref:ARAD1D37752p n=1 Tax=Blastobotrys adeninivorans TaxID=409370 RepID=A0A060TID0_BLAAD
MSALQDRRRILGPTDTVRLRVPREGDFPKVEREQERSRGPHEMRKIFLKQGIVANASGSAYVEIGDCQIQCTVNGPKPVRGLFTTQADLAVEFKFAPTTSTRTSLHGNNPEAALETHIASFVQSSVGPSILLDKYPKSSIHILLTVLSADSNTKSLAAAAVCAASVAVVDAGIAIRDIVTSGSVLLERQGAEIKSYSDPQCSGEEGDIEAVVSYMTARNDEITGIWFEGGAISPREMESTLKTTKNGATEVRALVNAVLLDEFKANNND